MASVLRFVVVFGLLAMAAVATAAPAMAQWIFRGTNTEEDPFLATQSMAMAVRDGVVIGFRCSSTDNLALVFVTIERPAGGPATQITAMMPAKLLVIVDDNERVKLDAEIDTTPGGDRYRVTATGDDVLPVMRAVSTGRRRFAVAVELFGNITHSKTFPLGGSGAAVRRLADMCKIKDFKSAALPLDHAPARP